MPIKFHGFIFLYIKAPIVYRLLLFFKKRKAESNQYSHLFVSTKLFNLPHIHRLFFTIYS